MVCNFRLMFRRQQRLRHWAAGVLLLWLFSAGVGVANACLAPRVVQAGSPPTAHAADASIAHQLGTAGGLAHPQDSDHARPRVAGHDEHGSTPESNCVDFCDKASSAPPPVLTPLTDLLGHALLLAAVVPTYPHPAHVPIRPQVPHHDDVRAPPIHIAFLRLTL